MADYFQIKNELKKVVKGEIFDDKETLKKYSRDASLFEVWPKLIIYPKDANMEKHLNIKDLTDNALQVMAILDAMLDWANGKGKSEYKKTEALDKVVKDLTKQVEALDKKLDRL